MIEYDFMKMVCDDMYKRQIPADQAYLIVGWKQDKEKFDNSMTYIHADTSQFILLLTMAIDRICHSNKLDPAKILDAIAFSLDILNPDYEGGSLDNK